MLRGACYIRVSTNDQTEFSPDAQFKAIRKYAENNDIIIDDDYIFLDEGISGRKADRSAVASRFERASGRTGNGLWGR